MKASLHERARTLKNARDSLDREIAKLAEERAELDEVRRYIDKYSLMVDIDGYSTVSKIARVIEWSKSGKYAKNFDA